MPGEDAGAPSRQKQILEEMGTLENAIASLASVVEESHNRLDSIVRAPESAPEKSTDKVEVALVPLAENLRSLRYRVTNQSSNLRDMLSRLEL